MKNLSPHPNNPIQPKYRLNETKLHRFVPTEKPRAVVEHTISAPTKIAGSVGFNPIATVTLPDKTVFVRPVKNTHSRAISPGVVNSSGQLDVTGERTIAISDNLHSQIKAKVTSTMKALVPPKPKTQPVTPEHYVTSANLQNLIKPIPTAQPAESQVQTQARNDVLKDQLEVLNKSLFEQIKGKVYVEISKQSSEQKPAQTSTVSAVTKPATPTIRPLAETKPLQQPGPAPLTQSGPQSQPTREHLRALIETKPTETKSEEIKLPLPIPAPAQVKPREILPTLSNVNVSVQKESPSPSLSTKVVVPVQKAEPAQDSLTSYKQHINHLEEELGLLNKEVNYMDRTMADLEKERDLQELTSLEKKIDVDRQMLLAVADWRAALNNLINSHTVALKYLKQKTDWLESQVDRLSGHRDKHARSHHKPKPIEIKMSPLPQITTSPTAEEPSTVIVPTVVKEVQTTSFDAVKSMVQEALRKEQPNIKPSDEAVKTLVDKTLENKELVGKAAPEDIQKAVDSTLKSQEHLFQEGIQKEIPNIRPTQESVKEVLDQTLKTEPSLVKPSVEEIQDIVKQELSQQKPQELRTVKPAMASKEDLKDMVKEIMSEGDVNIKPAQVTVNLTKDSFSQQSPPQQQPVVPGQTTAPVVNVTISQADIERQILDQAATEEAKRDALENAKKEAARKKAEGQALAKLAEVKTGQEGKPNVTTPPAQPQPEISEAVLKDTFAKLKIDLTTLDSQHNQQLADLSAGSRTEMIQKLQNLEKDTEVARQYDELKAAAERRRINTELQNMFANRDAKTAVATSQEPPNQQLQQKTETLKLEQKSQQTPAEKARLIAEIKELDRQAQARKAVEASRPVIKAQPAYGKMLPNTPTVPNIINGIVKDAKGLLLPTVIIIVKDLTGEPVRALKTNKIGQFALSTAVPNGTYTLDLEKDGYEFDIIEVDVNGTIMQPIEIKSKS